jgi:dTDP-4-dehydrorhamnose reductase
VEVTRALAELAQDCQFVFFSTDLVFDGKKGNYIETAETNPLSVYAETKAAAEQIILTHPKHQVIRTSLNAGISFTGDRAFNEEMRQAWKNGTELRLFIDEFRCPIAAEVTARATWELISKGKPGIYHLAGSERLSRYQIGQLLATRWQALCPKYRPASLKEYQGAPRAADTSLNCDKIQKLLSFPLPGFRTWLASPAAGEL